MKNPEVPYYCSDSDVWYERSKKLGIVDIN